MYSRLRTMLLSALVIAGAAQAVTYYVKPAGSDTRTGRDTTNAFATIQKAADLTNPGDTVLVMNGTYTNPEAGYTDFLSITRSGTPASWIRFRAYPGHRPRIYVDCYIAIHVKGASYIEVAGFEVQGNKAGMTLDSAVLHQNDDIAVLDNDGISVGPAGGNHANPQPPYPHHVVIRNNHVHHFAGAGIGTFMADYVTFADNVVHSCCWYTPWAKSGIGMGWMYNSDDSTGYKLFVTGNIVYDCETYIKWRSINNWSDGNGMIFDTYNMADRAGFQPYRGRTLVQNNVVYNNGGSGMHAFRSAHIDMVNNTAYMNSRSANLPDPYPNIGAHSCSDVRIYNNIMYARAGKPVNSYGSDTDVVYDYNVYYGGLAPRHPGAHDTVADPRFVRPALDSTADFRLQAGSPAINSGTTQLAPATDVAGVARPQGSAVDRGAYEYVVTAAGVRAAARQAVRARRPGRAVDTMGRKVAPDRARSGGGRHNRVIAGD